MHTIVFSPDSVIQNLLCCRRKRLQAGAVLCYLWCSVAMCEDGVEFFEDRIEPILIDNCYRCHSSETDDPAGGFLIDSKDGIRRGGETGPAVVPEDVDESLLISAIEYRDLEMPPEEKLDDDVIADFKTWIQMGAPDPRSDDDDDDHSDDEKHSDGEKHSSVEDFKKAVLRNVESVGSEQAQLRKWRDEQQRAFQKLYAVAPTEISNAVCQMFVKTPAQQMARVALTVPRFVNMPESRLEFSESTLAKWGPLRERQFEQFLSSSEFRKRFLQLVVWQGSFCGDSSDVKSDRIGPFVNCGKVAFRHVACRKACAGTDGLKDFEKLNCVLLMGLTARHDLLQKVRNGEKLESVFNEWSHWFEMSQDQLVQRRDGTGWIRIDDDDSTEIFTVRYPQLLRPASPAFGQVSVPASFRKLFIH